MLRLWLPAAPVSIRGRSWTTSKTWRVFPIRAASAYTTWRIVIAVVPAFCALVPPAITGMPVAIPRIVVISRISRGEADFFAAHDDHAAIWARAWAADGARWVFPICPWSANRAGRVVITIVRASAREASNHKDQSGGDAVFHLNTSCSYMRCNAQRSCLRRS